MKVRSTVRNWGAYLCSKRTRNLWEVSCNSDSARPRIPDTPTTKTGVIVEYEDGERSIERILFDSNRLIPWKKDPSIASFGKAANISEKGSDPNVDLRNFRQHCSELHTNVLPPAIAQDYCKEALSFEIFTATKYESCMRLDLRTEEEGYLVSKIDLRTYWALYTRDTTTPTSV